MWLTSPALLTCWEVGSVEVDKLRGQTLLFSVCNQLSSSRSAASGLRGDRHVATCEQVETGSAITWKYPSVVLRGDGSVGEFYSVALTNNYQQACLVLSCCAHTGCVCHANMQKKWCLIFQAQLCLSIPAKVDARSCLAPAGEIHLKRSGLIKSHCTIIERLCFAVLKQAVGVGQADTGTKMVHIGKNTRSRIVSKGISAGHSRNCYRGLVQARLPACLLSVVRAAVQLSDLLVRSLWTAYLRVCASYASEAECTFQVMHDVQVGVQVGFWVRGVAA